MEPIKKVTFGILVFLALTAVACGLVGTPQPGTSPDALFTQGAQTVQAQLTQQAIDTLVAQLTQVAGGATATPGAAGDATSTSASPALPTATPSPTPIVVLPSPTSPVVVLPSPTVYIPVPTATQRPLSCNLAHFVKDVTIPDGTTLRPGEDFTKVWRLKNVGTCTWNSSYALVFSSGDRMGGARSQALDRTVRPGETVDVKVDLTAPIATGRYRGNWMLRAANGALFGIGQQGTTAFWVQIRVEGRASSPYEYDFAAWVCTADWRSSAGRLDCPGDPDDEDGSVVLLEQPELENGRRENELAIWTRPEETNGGRITGVYPAYTVQSGDRFVADVGCLADSEGCDVTFGLSYIEGSSITHLGNWRETYDGKLTRIEIDLSPLAGKTVQFSLGVTANSRPGRADAFWLAPSIRAGKPVPQMQVVLAWKQEGGIAGICSLLEIMSNGTNAEAIAYDCRNNQPIVINRRPLTAQELQIINTWQAVYAPIEFQENEPFPDGMKTVLVLVGKGTYTAPDGDIQTMRLWSASLFQNVANP